MHVEKAGAARMALLVVLTIPPALLAVVFLGASFCSDLGSPLLPLVIGGVLVAPTVQAWATFRQRPNHVLLLQTFPLLVSVALVGALALDSALHK